MNRGVFRYLLRELRSFDRTDAVIVVVVTIVTLGYLVARDLMQ